MRKLVFVLMVVFCISAKSQYNNGVVLEMIMKSDTTSVGQKIKYPDFVSNEVSIVRVTIPPGKSTGWHKHVFPVFAYVLQGVLTVEVENRAPKVYNPNSAFSEVINILHNGVNRGETDVVLIAYFMGEKGKPLSTH